MKAMLFIFNILLLSSCTIYTISDEKANHYKGELTLPISLDTIAVKNYRSFIFSYPLNQIKRNEQFLLELFDDQRDIDKMNKKITKVEKKIKKMRDKESKLRREIEKFEKEKLKKKFEIDYKINQFKITQD